jgi:hypothetical protein
MCATTSGSNPARSDGHAHTNIRKSREVRRRWAPNYRSRSAHLGAGGSARFGAACSNPISSADVLVDLPSGGEALLLAASLSVPDFVGVMDDVRDGEIHAQGR